MHPKDDPMHCQMDLMHPEGTLPELGAGSQPSLDLPKPTSDLKFYEQMNQQLFLNA